MSHHVTLEKKKKQSINVRCRSTIFHPWVGGSNNKWFWCTIAIWMSITCKEILKRLKGKKGKFKEYIRGLFCSKLIAPSLPDLERIILFLTKIIIIIAYSSCKWHSSYSQISFVGAKTSWGILLPLILGLNHDQPSEVYSCVYFLQCFGKFLTFDMRKLVCVVFCTHVLCVKEDPRIDLFVKYVWRLKSFHVEFDCKVKIYHLNTKKTQDIWGVSFRVPKVSTFHYDSNDVRRWVWNITPLYTRKL